MAVEKASEDGASDNLRDWSKSEDEQLLDFLINKHGEDEKTYRSVTKRVEWENTGIEGRTARECHARWNSLVTFARTYRTVKEIAEDLKTVITNPALYKSLKMKDAKSHPDFPKAPLTAYMMFFADTKRKIEAEDPDVKHKAVSMSKIIASAYRNMREQKKEAYAAKAKAAKDEYQEKLDQFFRDHPMYRNLESERDVQPKRPTTAFMEFVRSTLEDGDVYDDQEQLPADVKAELKEEYSKLTTKKKLKYIKKAVAKVDDYADQLAVFAAMHAELKRWPSIKQICTPEEFKMLDRSVGKPKPPPSSSYALFCQEKTASGELAGKNAKDRMLELPNMWKMVNDYEKAKYSMAVAEAKLRYQQELEDWKQKSGGECQKHRQLTYELVKKRGLFMYALENADACREKCPNFFEAEIRQVLIADYKKLPEDRRQEYEDRASVSVAWQKKRSRNKNPKTLLFKNEPEKVPRTALDLFVRESLSKETGKMKVMKQVKARWNSLSQKEKDNYEQRCNIMKEGYAKRFKEFVNGLSQTELAEFKRMRGADAPMGSLGRKESSETSDAENSSSEEDGEEDSGEEEDFPSPVKYGVDQPKQLQEPLNSNGNNESQAGRKSESSTSSSDSSPSASEEEEEDEIVSKKPNVTGKQQASPRSQNASKAGKSSSSSSSSSDSDEEAEKVDSFEVKKEPLSPRKSLQARKEESDDDSDDDTDDEDELAPVAPAALKFGSALNGKKTVLSPALKASPKTTSSGRKPEGKEESSSESDEEEEPMKSVSQSFAKKADRTVTVSASGRKPERKEETSDSSDDEELRRVLAESSAKKVGKATPNPASPGKSASGRKPERKEETSDSSDDEELRRVLAQSFAKKVGKATPNPASPRKSASGRKSERKEESDDEEDSEPPRASPKKRASSVQSSRKESTTTAEKAKRKRAEESEEEEEEEPRVKSSKKDKKNERRAESPSMLRTPGQKRKHGEKAVEEEDHSQGSRSTAAKKKKSEVATSTPLPVAEQLKRKRKTKE